ncbi:sodium:solute symporter family transporter [Brevibacillus centrosporus]|uniref:sodium:solute symporter family transporter n=1 Tax=Brevibacillus centrosporus TaxID=54910 RepID=UPI00398767A1
MASMLQGVSAVKPQLLTLPGVGMSVTWFISTVVLSTVGFFMWPNAFLSTFSAKSDKALRRNSMMLPLYSLMQLFSIMVAFTAVLSIPGLKGAEGDLGLIKLALQTFDPWFVGLIGAAGLLGALVPCSVLLIAASSMLTKNVYTSFAPASSDLQLAKVAKGITLLLALVVLYFTLNAGSALITFYLMSYNFITQLAPALFFSLLKNNFITRQGAISGMVVGLLLAIYVGMTNMTTAALFPAMPSFIQDINIGLLILILNLVTMLIVSSITKPKDVAI